MPSEFVHLHVHTEYSLLDGQSRIPSLIKRAQELEMPAVGISDHGVMFGVIDFYRKAKDAGVKPVLGMEAYLAPRNRGDKDPVLDKKPYHLLLFAKDNTGYKNLMKLASIAQLEGYYYRPRVDWEVLAQYSEGIIATSGCLAAEIPRLVEDGKDDEARAKIGQYLDVFGEENFYLELQPHKIDQLKLLNEWLVDYRKSNHTNVQFYASNDVHYVYQTDWDVHDTLLCIQTGSLKQEENRMRMDPNDSYFMKSADEMRAEFLKHGMPENMITEAFANSLKIADMTNVDLDDKTYKLPIFPLPPEFGEDNAAYLRYLCEMGLEWRYPSAKDDPILKERLDYELGVIGGMGFNTYFLIVWDLCEFAREVDIWWNVRGSGAGSLVAYCLGITNIDPIQNSLLFERFLNSGRVSMPDIDLDYPDDRRGEMIAYAADKYGKDKVAAIITFGTMGAKASVKDVGRALNVDLAKVNYATSLIPQDAKQKPIQEYIEANPELKDFYNKDAEIRRVMDAAIQLQGMTRHASTHAAGVIIADKPLDEYAPLHRITGTDPSGGSLEAVTQFPMETAESIGLLKVDFLGLSTLTILRKACDLINKHHGTNYTMDNIPYRHDDTKQKLTDEQVRMLDESFEMLGRGDTVGVFQVESGGMQSMLRGMRPQKFEHIIAGISLYRPGPMDFIPDFNKRLHGEEEVPYKHPLLAPILGETFGICITGDSLVIDVETGKRHRMDELEPYAGQICVQGVDAENKPLVARLTHWFNNGRKPVYRLKLRNGASIKATADHQFLTEEGWVELQDLKIGDFIATPKSLAEPKSPAKFNRDKLRILGYLIADGGLSNLAQVNFFSKDESLLNEYRRCLTVFEDVEPVFIQQVRGVSRIAAKHKDGRYVTELLAWMRELGLKTPPYLKRGGVLSHEKFVPEFVFELPNDDIAYFLASMWDCDGYMSRKLCHYKTIAPKLAHDVQTLLLRLGISSVIHENAYENEKRDNQTSYQVTVYDTAILASHLQPYMVTWKKDVLCEGYTNTTISREDFILEAKNITGLSACAMMEQYGIDRQHFYKRRADSERISARVVSGIAEAAHLETTLNRINVNWEAIVEIEPAGDEQVYDITVEGIHNFVANNIIVHNCVYQEQIMQIATALFGYGRSEADLMRRAVSKKKAKDLAQHKDIFKQRGPENGIPEDVAEAIFDEIEFFANYGFNKSHAADYAVITVQTAFLKCHYPAEYMTALLTVQFDDSNKVATFLEECRRLQIPVLPPHVNNSAIDFDIEVTPEGKRGIRFGMGAIKNAGVGAVQHILDERQAKGKFKSLVDFCQRVDLRQVGKRAVESLIKVGAFEGWGERDDLLYSLERITGFSADYHKAADVGQMSLFGAVSDSAGIESLEIPEAPQKEKFTRRQQLGWEKDLMGLYVSGRPVDKHVATFRAMGNLHIISELKDPEMPKPKEGVRIAGEVVALKKVTTKKGDSMAILSLEDWHESAGSIEVVMFPNTWQKVRDHVHQYKKEKALENGETIPETGIMELEEGDIILVMGKLDTSRETIQILGDKITFEFEVMTSDEIMATLNHTRSDPSWMNNNYQQDDNNGNGNGYHGSHEEPPIDLDFDEETGEVIQQAPVPIAKSTEIIQQSAEAPAWAKEAETSSAENPFTDISGGKISNGRNPVHISVQFERSNDTGRDRRRLRRIHAAMMQYPGKDSFSITILGAKDSTMDFPNHTTGWCKELLNDLEEIVGKDKVIIAEK